MSNAVTSSNPRSLPALGKYRLLAEIGRGGMAEVFLGVIEGPGQFSKLIALKILRQQFAEDPDGRAMFLDEARLAARLAHPNIVQTFEVGESDGRYFIAMEYLDGQPFSRIQARGRLPDHTPMPLTMQLRVLADMLNGLHYAHELNDFDGSALKLIHRDVSPHNVFVTYDGLIKVLDFGIAKAVGGSAETKTGVLKGKVSYMAPEQVLDRPIDRRVDVYAAGVMLWEMLANRRLWKGTTDVAILTKVANEGIPSPATVQADIPRALEEICVKATARDREQRYDSAADFAAAIEEYLDAIRERTTARVIAKHVSSSFAEMRAESQRLIESQLSRAKTHPTESIATLALPTSVSGSNPSLRNSSALAGEANLPPLVARDGFASPGTPSSASLSSVSVGEPTQTPSQVGKIAAAVVAVVAIGAAMFLLVRKEDPATPPPLAGLSAPSTSASASTQVAVAKSATPTVEPSAAPPPVGSVLFKVTPIPADARIFCDDVLLSGNDVREPKDGRSHTLRVEADGYAARSDQVAADDDHAVTVRLVKLPTSTGWKPRPKDAAAAATAATAAATTAVVTAPPPQPPPPPTGTGKRPIDTDNPFGK